MHVANQFCYTDVTPACEMDNKNRLITFIIVFKTHFTSSRTSYCSTSPLSLAARLYNETDRDNSKINKLLAKHQMFKNTQHQNYTVTII